MNLVKTDRKIVRVRIVELGSHYGLGIDCDDDHNLVYITRKVVEKLMALSDWWIGATVKMTVLPDNSWTRLHRHCSFVAINRILDGFLAAPKPALVRVEKFDENKFGFGVVFDSGGVGGIDVDEKVYIPVSKVKKLEEKGIKPGSIVAAELAAIKRPNDSNSLVTRCFYTDYSGNIIL